MVAIPESRAIANPSTLYLFTRGSVTFGDDGTVIPEVVNSLDAFDGYAFVVTGSQTVAVAAGALYTFPHGDLRYVTHRIGTFAEFSIFEVPVDGSGNLLQQPQKYDPATSTVAVGAYAAHAPSTSISNWTQNGITVLPPDGAVFAVPFVHLANIAGSIAWYFDAFNLQDVPASEAAKLPLTATLQPWTPPRALEVDVVDSPHDSYQDLTTRLSILRRILQQSVPLGMRVLEPTFED